MGKAEPEEGEAPGLRWYVEVCEAYEGAFTSTQDDDLENAEEVFERYGISYQDSCGFAIFGFETQKWLNFESELVEAAGYKDKLLAIVRAYARQLTEQHQIIKDSSDRLREQLENGK